MLAWFNESESMQSPLPAKVVTAPIFAIYPVGNTSVRASIRFRLLLQEAMRQVHKLESSLIAKVAETVDCILPVACISNWIYGKYWSSDNFGR